MQEISEVRFSSDTTNEEYEKDLDYFDFNSPIFLSLEKHILSTLINLNILNNTMKNMENI